MSFKALLSLLILAAPAAASEPAEPVFEIMSITEGNWATEPAEHQNVFSEDRLSRLFSEDFAALYQEAMNTPYAQESGSPFDYDVVVNAQDGCPLENITVSPPQRMQDKTAVTVRFQFLSCLGADDEYQIYSTTRFDLVVKDGQALVDDIVATNPEGLTLSAREQLRAAIDASGE